MIDPKTITAEFLDELSKRVMAGTLTDDDFDVLSYLVQQAHDRMIRESE